MILRENTGGIAYISDISLYNEASAYSLLLETFLPWHKMISVLVPNGNYNYTGVVGNSTVVCPDPKQGSFTAKGEPLDVDIGFVPNPAELFEYCSKVLNVTTSSITTTIPNTTTNTTTITNTTIGTTTIPPMPIICNKFLGILGCSSGYQVTFTETGLPESGLLCSLGIGCSVPQSNVTLDGAAQSSTGATITTFYATQNGTYAYSITTPGTNNYTANPQSSSIEVHGSKVNVAVNFTKNNTTTNNTKSNRTSYNVTFKETGLPTQGLSILWCWLSDIVTSGSWCSVSSWNVTIAGIPYATVSTSQTITLSAGKYVYTPSSFGYYALSDTLIEPGATNVNITFSSSPITVSSTTTSSSSTTTIMPSIATQ